MNSRETNARYRHALTRVGPVGLGRILVIAMLVLGTQAASAVDCNPTTRICTCKADTIAQGDDRWSSASSTLFDLQVTGKCFVALAPDFGPRFSYYFKNVNILNGGNLLFYEIDYPAGTITNFWASSIIVENGGTLQAYGSDDGNAFGFRGGVLTIHLYGKNEAEGKPDQQNQGALCMTPRGPGPGPDPNIPPCGIPQDIWDSNGASEKDLPGLDAQGKPVRDYFYQYGPLHGDGKCDDESVFKVINGKGTCNTSRGQVGYFGNKVLAVSYGGSLYLTGYKGASFLRHLGADPDDDPLYSGKSWMRLANGQSLGVNDTSLSSKGIRTIGTIRRADASSIMPTFVRAGALATK
jgi:hypothetical protein